MHLIHRRGTSASKPTGRGARLGAAIIAAVVMSLATAISAFAAGSASSPGVGGPGFITQTDTTPSAYTQPPGYTAPANDGLGAPGLIKHVWLITLENHAYDASFTGSNANSYLWQTLPSKGALLTNYYATGHSSQDNYLTSVSGQGPLPDQQNDCPSYNTAPGTVDTSGGSLAANANYGQFVAANGAEAPSGDNGCVFPASVPTLFNQLDANHESWKLYAQDGAYPGNTATNFNNQNGGGTAACDAPDAAVGAAPSATQTSDPAAKSTATSFNPEYDYGSATSTSGYVAKHNPLPWFQSILGSGDCAAGLTGGQYGNSSHLAELFGANDQLAADLSNEANTPALSIVQPNNCSDGHDAICANNSTGANATNNLSGGFTGQTPNPSFNNVGGLYAADLFLGHVIPEIQNSDAYKDGGMIIVNFDEAYPPFTYSGDSFTDSSTQAPTAAATVANIDSAGETLFGRSVSWEPSGPNTPAITSQAGQQMSAGAGFNEYLDRPDNSAAAPLEPCTKGTAAATGGAPGTGFLYIPTGQCYDGGGTIGTTNSRNALSTTGSTLTLGTGADGGTTVTQQNTSTFNLFNPAQQGESVTVNNGTVAEAGTVSSTPSPLTAYLGKVSANLPAASGQAPSNNQGTVTSGTTDTTPVDQASTAKFELYDANGNPLTITPGSGTLSLSTAGETPANDPLYDAFDATPGGGDTGAVVLSPYINGGTVSNTDYNHYSLLRTLEDIFQVQNGSGSAAGYTGSINISKGVDGQGHLGYAAQAGLAPFGTDVFDNLPASATPTTTVTSTISKTVTSVLTQTVPGAAFTVTQNDNFALVPDVRGDSYATGHKILNKASFHLGKITGSTKAKHGYVVEIVSETPKAGVYSKAGATVAITVKSVKVKK